MNEKKIKREWVKTAAIIFLSVMLVLTFFSNTIMNMSLPEVSTDNIQYGSIKTQVRGSGTVLSLENYSVTFPYTREVKSVSVRQGETVQKGDVLFVLEESESDELASARKNYENLKYEYDKMIINSAGGGEYGALQRQIAQLTKDLNKAKTKLETLTADTAVYESEHDRLTAEIKALNKKITSKQNEISELEAEKSAIGYTPTEEEVLTGKKTDVTYEQYVSAANQSQELENKVDEAETKLASEKKSLEALEKELARIESKLADLPSTEKIEALEKEITQSDRNIEELERSLKYLKQDFYDATTNRDLEMLYEKFKKKQKDYLKAKEAYEELLANGGSEEEIEQAKKKYYDAENAVDDAFDAYNAVLTAEDAAANAEEKALAEAENNLKYALEDNNALKTELAEYKENYYKTEEYEAQKKDVESKIETAEDAVYLAQTVYDNAVSDKEAVEKSLDKIRNGYKYGKVQQYEENISAKEDELELLKDELETLSEELSDLESDKPEDEATVEKEIESLEDQLEEANESLEDKKLAASDEEKLQSMEIEKAGKELDEALAELTKLEAKVTANEVVAPVSGVIETINVTAGQKIQPDSTIAEISLAEKGYRMTMTVTQEQASKLRIGSSAEVTSYVPYGSEINVTLSSIKSDTANPGSRQKILEFVIDGDVSSGQNISVSVGDKNASYENTVPNTAIREDSNGKYVLVVDSKATAISTRYTARRVAVNVLASDDTRSAISGEFDSYAYVVSASSKPIGDGEQVKLVED